MARILALGVAPASDSASGIGAAKADAMKKIEKIWKQKEFVEEIWFVFIRIFYAILLGSMAFRICEDFQMRYSSSL